MKDTVERKTILWSVLFVLVALVVVGATVLFSRYQAEQKRMREADFTQVQTTPTPDTYTDLTGTSQSLEMYRGKPVMLMAWASWCPSCGDQLALVAKVAKDVGTDMPILAVNRKETREAANLYLDVVGRYEKLIYIVDTEDHFFKKSAGFAMPEFIVYGKDGMEKFHSRGTITEDELRQVFTDSGG